jgi:hypothetical protein
MIQPSTLHDFVLNLLSDPSLKAAFATDAQGTLEQAGLADITAVDVQEVIPLVIDLLPETPAGVPSLEGVYRRVSRRTSSRRDRSAPSASCRPSRLS